MSLYTSGSAAGFADLTTLCKFPSFILACNDFSIGSAYGFTSSTTFPEWSTFAPADFAAICFCYSVNAGISPFYLSVKKNLPCFEFLSGTTEASAPAFFLIFKDASIGSSFLYISSISSFSVDFWVGPILFIGFLGAVVLDSSFDCWEDAVVGLELVDAALFCIVDGAFIPVERAGVFSEVFAALATLFAATTVLAVLTNDDVFEPVVGATDGRLMPKPVRGVVNFVDDSSFGEDLRDALPEEPTAVPGLDVVGFVTVRVGVGLGSGLAAAEDPILLAGRVDIFDLVLVVDGCFLIDCSTSPYNALTSA